MLMIIILISVELASKWGRVASIRVNVARILSIISQIANVNRADFLRTLLAVYPVFTIKQSATKHVVNLWYKMDDIRSIFVISVVYTLWLLALGCCYRLLSIAYCSPGGAALPVLAIVCLIEWMLLMSHDATYGGVLEIDVSIMSIIISLPSVIS